ncbi:LamG domain-containing protein [Candidatus Woesearchaeota archaeon]|nr:LamG domain-containing protein [Candidatus Woesearchaeota archaeon]
MYLRVIQDTDFTPSFIITNDVPTTLVQLTGSAISYGGWHHIAVVEDGDNYYLFVDGVLEDSTTDTDRPANYPTNILIGDNYKGLIDEVRVSKGVARWTTDFTPPTQPYS